MRPLVRLLLSCFLLLTGAGVLPTRAATAPNWPRPLPSPVAGSNRLPFPEASLFEANSSLLKTLLAQPLEINHTLSTMAVNPAAASPRLNNLIVANISGTQAAAGYGSDIPSSTLLYVTSPLAEFSSPGLTTNHTQALTNLSPGTGYRLRALGVSADLGLGALPDVVFTTALPAQAGGTPQVVGGLADLVNDPNDPNAVFAVISFRNVGGGDAADVSLTALNVSPGWSFTSPLPMPLDLGTLGSGASGVILTRLSFTGTPPATNPLITGTGTVTVAGGTPQPFNLGGTVPELFVTKTVDNAAAHPGDVVTFTVTATNRGLGPATNLLLGDVLPSGLTFVDAATGGQFQNGVVVWSPGSLAPGASGSVTFRAQIASAVPAGTTITNIAQARSAEIPIPVAGGASVITVTALPLPQLQLSKTADTNTALPGQTVNFTITAQNTGPGPATNVQILDQIPAGTSFQAADSGGALVNNGTVGWTLPTLAPQATATVHLQLLVTGGAAGASIANVAQIGSAEVTTPIASNSGSPVVITVASPPQLQLSKAVDKATAAPGETLTYTLTYGNTGQALANPVVILDQLPAGVTFGAAQSNGQLVNGTAPNNGQFVRFDLGAVPPGGSGSVQFTVTVNSGLAAGTQIANQAAINTPGLAQPVVSNTVTTAVAQPPPALALTKAVDKSTAAQGDTLTYTLTYANTGGGPANSVVIQDPLPAGVTFGAAQNNGQVVSGIAPNNGQAVQFNLGTVAPGASGSVQFSVIVSSSLGAGTPIVKQASITAAELTQAVASNTVTTTLAVSPPALTLTKSVDKATAAPGDTLTYTISYANTGTGVANPAVILDQLPAGVTFGAAQNNGSLVSGNPPNNGQFVRFDLGALPPGASGTVQFTVTVNPNTPVGTPITNQAAINTPGLAQPVVSNSVTTTVAAPAPPQPTVSPFAGTWSSLPAGQTPPVAQHASLTVDAQGHFTVWSRSQDGQTVAHGAQGVISATGAFDVTSADNLVHFTGQISADLQTAQITVARSGSVTFTITAPKRTDLNAVPASFVGTFNGFSVAANGDRLQVLISVDPGGNASLASDLIRANNAGEIRQFATLGLSPDGRLISSNGNVVIGLMQVVNGSLGLVYNFQAADAGYQNTFPVALSPFTGQ